MHVLTQTATMNSFCWSSELHRSWTTGLLLLKVRAVSNLAMRYALTCDISDGDVDTELFSRDSSSHVPTINLFSVLTPGCAMSLKNRQIVTYEGDDNGHGRWSCTRDKEAGCTHVSQACDRLQQLVQADPHARHTTDDMPPRLNTVGKCKTYESANKSDR